MVKKVVLSIILFLSASTSLVVNANDFQSDKNLIKRLPKEVKQVLYDYTFIKPSKASEFIKEHYEGKAYGLTVINTKEIAIDNYRYTGDYWLDNYRELTLYHEIGHAYDYIEGVGYRSKGSEFLNIFNEEKANFKGDNTEYHTSNVHEYFAEAFSYYFYDDYTRELLKEAVPKTYEYFDNLFN